MHIPHGGLQLWNISTEKEYNPSMWHTDILIFDICQEPSHKADRYRRSVSYWRSYEYKETIRSASGLQQLKLKPQTK